MLVMIVRSRQQLLTSSENDFSIDRLVMQLNQHYMKDWTVSSMAKYCKLSVGYFSHIFKERMDAAPMHYLNDLRIEKAKELISTNTMKLSDVASMVGFSDSLYFSRVLKRLPEFLQRNTSSLYLPRTLRTGGLTNSGLSVHRYHI